MNKEDKINIEISRYFGVWDNQIKKENKANDFRKQFWQTISELAKKDDKIIILTGDLGFSFCELFAKKYPKQFINCGIAEQNMIGVACGLALQGFKPYCYSNSIFLLGRAYEFIRDDVCYNNLNVKLIGTGAAGFLGFSHNWGEKESERNLLDNLPNIIQFYPGDKNELKKVIKLSNIIGQPVFIRI